MIHDKKPLGRKLLSRAQKGDMPAFEGLVERYRDDLYSFALRMTRSETAALEIVQECFLAAYRHLNEFPTEAEFRTWIHWIAANQALNGVPPLQSPDFLLDGAVARRLAIDCADDTDEPTLRPQMRRAIEEAMESLPRCQREVFLLKDVARLGYQQIANITRERVPNIKIHLHQARLTICERIASV